MRRTSALAWVRTPVLLTSAHHHHHHHDSSAAAPVGMLAKSKYYAWMAYDGIRHVYHGFKLFGSNTKVAASIMMRVRNGEAITRRERLLLERATLDLLRLLPFSFFVIVPFAELLLPVALKMFPGLIPSTFESETQGRNKAFATEMMKVTARARLIEHATSQIVAWKTSAKNMRDVNDVLRRATCNDKIAPGDIKRLASAFGPNAPLNMERLRTQPRVLKSMAQAMGIYKSYYGIVPVRYLGGPLNHAIQLQMAKLRSDDNQLAKEGLAMLTRDELEHANHTRGMRWVDDDAALLKQLQDWIDLSADPTVPYHTLFFVRPTFHSLSESMRSLPEDTRKKLMTIMRGELPAHVAENLEELVGRVEKRGTKELEVVNETADDIRAKAEKTDSEATVIASPEKTLGANTATRRALKEYLSTADLDRIYDDISIENGEVTIKLVIKHLSVKTRVSSHEISNVFDALDFTDQSSTISFKAFRRLAKRLASADV